jgi:hypothetical protein
MHLPGPPLVLASPPSPCVRPPWPPSAPVGASWPSQLSQPLHSSSPALGCVGWPLFVHVCTRPFVRVLVLAGPPLPLLLLPLFAPAAAISPPTFHPPLRPCSFTRLFTHSFVPAPATWSCWLGLHLAFVHARLRSFCAHWFVWPSFGFVRAHSCYLGHGWGSLHAPQPLVYVYIKHYKVSKYMILKLTFVA